MTPSEIEKLAREAGAYTEMLGSGEYPDGCGMVFKDEGDDDSSYPSLCRFAELIERAAMEKAAKIAERHYIYGHSVAGPEFAARGAAAIRAAAQKEANPT